MICNVCHVVTGLLMRCDVCNQHTCERCLNVRYSNFKHQDGNFDLDYVCSVCCGYVPNIYFDPYSYMQYTPYEFLAQFVPPSRCSNDRREAYLLLARLFWFRYPIHRELPSRADSLIMRSYTRHIAGWNVRVYVRGQLVASEWKEVIQCS